MKTIVRTPLHTAQQHGGALVEGVLVELQKVCFGFGPRLVVDQVDLRIRQGDYLAILGPNGGGKTTLLKLMLGLYQPWSGDIRSQLGHDDGGRPRGLGWVPQFASFDRSFPLDVFGAVLLGRAAKRGLLRRWNHQDRHATETALHQVGLLDQRRRPLSDLSGGELQRALIARALVSEPALLLLDEPAASIDPRSREILMRTLRELNQTIPIVVVTHDLTLFARDIKQVACMNRQLHYHDGPHLPQAVIEHVYGCPVELLGHLHGPDGCSLVLPAGESAAP